MSPNKPNTPADQPDISSEQAELNRKVDAALEPDTEMSEAPTAAVAVPEISEDSKTEAAVSDIAAKESDEVLASEDTGSQENIPAAPPPGWKTRLKAVVRNKWTWAGAAALLLIVFALPVTRYKALGLVIKKPAIVTVVDSTTHTPVSNAVVIINGAQGKTDANGKARLRAPLGKSRLTIEKKYFKTYTGTTFVGFKSPADIKVSLTATGRQVPITVVNLISGKAVSGAEIKVLDTTAKTNNKGEATIVLPTQAGRYRGNVSLKSFNTLQTEFVVTDRRVAANTVRLTPAGHVYFLSNLSGTIDVVRTNLDGSSRKTVLAGTGKEDADSTSLLASRDWKYLVLKARRNTAQPALYAIDTSTDKATPFDTTVANFTLAGWYGHNFIYDLEKNTVSQWQAGREAIKSYNAENGQLNQLDQNQAEGSATAYAYQNFSNFYITNNALVYTINWFTYSLSGPYDLNGKSASIRSVQPTGQNKKDQQSFPAASTGYIQAALYEPQDIRYAVYDSTSGKTNYYEYSNGGTSSANLDPSDFNKQYPTYLLSPSGNQTFWTELRDGKNTLFVGDASAGGKKQIASLSDYAPYGWYGDSYLLVSKNSSELYAMPAGVLGSSQKPIKITDYYKPSQTFTGYGYGYGGL